MLPLLSLRLLVLLVALSAGAVLATVLLWRRLASRHPIAVVGRVVMMLLCQVTALAVLAVYVNSSYQFFTSWGDLTGHPPAAEATSPPPVPAHYKVGVQPVAVARVHGELLRTWLAGPKTHLGTWAFVYLPPEYFFPEYAHTRFPASVWLSGYPGSGNTILQHLDLIQGMQREVFADHAQPMVLVMMSPTLAPPRDTECADVPHGPQVRSYFGVDVPALLRGRYRVSDSRTGLAIAGLSTGGFCAATIVLHFPRVYSSAVCVSGYYSALLDATTGALYGGSRLLQDENDPLWLLAHEPAPEVSVLLTASRQEKEVYASSQALLAAVRPPMTVSARFIPSGGHNYTNFRTVLPQVLDWLSARLSPQSTPAGPQAARRLLPGSRPPGEVSATVRR